MVVASHHGVLTNEHLQVEVNVNFPRMKGYDMGDQGPELGTSMGLNDDAIQPLQVIVDVRNAVAALESLLNELT